MSGGHPWEPEDTVCGNEPSASLEVALLFGSLKKALLEKGVSIFTPEAFSLSLGCGHLDRFIWVWCTRPP